VVDVSAFFGSFGALQARSSQHGADVVIALDKNDKLELANVTLGALTVGDFLFV